MLRLVSTNTQEDKPTAQASPVYSVMQIRKRLTPTRFTRLVSLLGTPLKTFYALQEYQRRYVLTRVEVCSRIGPWTKSWTEQLGQDSPLLSSSLVFTTNSTLMGVLRLTVQRYYAPLVFFIIERDGKRTLASLPDGTR
jgi:hypothetical protein